MPASPAGHDPACAPDVGATPVILDRVIDGDTVVLAGGEHVRMIGIDAPELGHDGAPDQPGAAAARAWLDARLHAGVRLMAVPDREDRDRHGRLLRHLFLASGTNLQATMLSDGLATPLLIPPSLGYLSCYQSAAKQAAAARRGLWARPEYQPLDVAALAPDTRGFRIVRAQVVRLHRSRHSVWLELDGPMSVTIPATSVTLFDAGALEALPGRRMEFRGMVYPRGRGLRMYLRHPLDLTEPAGEGNSAAPIESE